MIVATTDFGKAQALSKFAVLRPAGLHATGLTIRVEDPEGWGTVRYLCDVAGARVRVKEFAYDWGFSLGDPINLTTGSWGAFRSLQSFPVRDRFVGFRGIDYEGREAGSVVMYETHVEIAVLEGSLGLPAMRSLMEALEPIDAEAAASFERMPFALRSYHVRKRSPPWPTMPHVARMDWYANKEEMERRIGSKLAIETESVGLYSEAGTLWELGGRLRSAPHCTFLFVTTTDSERIAQLRAERIPRPDEIRENEPFFTYVMDVTGIRPKFSGRYGELPPFGPGGSQVEGERGILLVWFPPSRSYDRTLCQKTVSTLYRRMVPVAGISN